MPTIRLDAGALNSVYVPYMRDTRRYQIFFGGASSGKSVFLATRVVLDALQGRSTLVLRNVARTIGKSVWNETLKAISRMGLRAYFGVSKSDYVLTAKNNGAQILFAGLDDPEKIKSITPANGVLTDIWIEEATEVAYEAFKQLEKRLRGRSAHKKRMTLSFNPVYKTHWIYTTFFGGWEDGATVSDAPDRLILKTTYKDNLFLTDDDRAALESETDPYYRDVYTLGNWGTLGDVIFRNWRVEDLRELKNTADKLRYGLDFGFSSDPAAVIKIHYDGKRKRVYVLDELYERGLTNETLAAEVKRMAGRGYVTCDSAEPKSIDELRRLGVNALAAKKGKDSVEHGIQWLQQHEIIVDTSCAALRQELTLYQWRKDKDGNSLRVPEDKNNHLIDAMRYALEAESQQKIATTAKRSEYGL